MLEEDSAAHGTVQHLREGQFDLPDGKLVAVACGMIGMRQTAEPFAVTHRFWPLTKNRRFVVTSSQNSPSGSDVAAQTPRSLQRSFVYDARNGYPILCKGVAQRTNRGTRQVQLLCDHLIRNTLVSEQGQPAAHRYFLRNVLRGSR